MNNRVHRTSIIDRLTHTTRATAIMLAIPALLSLGMMLLTTVRYQRAMDRMATVAGLKPVVGIQLPEQLF
jgi:cytochrome b subunit of formate dehydrogenase